MSIVFEQLDLFGDTLIETEEEKPREILEEEMPKEKLEEIAQEKSEEFIEENSDGYFLESDFTKEELIKYNGEEGVFLHHYSIDRKSSAIRLGKSYIVVLTSAIERI